MSSGRPARRERGWRRRLWQQRRRLLLLPMGAPSQFPLYVWHPVAREIKCSPKSSCSLLTDITGQSAGQYHHHSTRISHPPHRSGKQVRALRYSQLHRTIAYLCQLGHRPACARQSSQAPSCSGRRREAQQEAPEREWRDAREWGRRCGDGRRWKSERECEREWS